MKVETISQHKGLKTDQFFKHFLQTIESVRAPKIEEHIKLVDELTSAALIVNDRMKNISPNIEQERSGGVLTISGANAQEDFLAVKQIGDVPLAKAKKYTTYSLGKTGILIANPDMRASSQNLVSDTPLKVEDNIIPGGAIRIGDDILSFSGYNPEDDEALILATAVQSGLSSRQATLTIAHDIGNIRYPEVIDQLLDQG